MQYPSPFQEKLTLLLWSGPAVLTYDESNEQPIWSGMEVPDVQGVYTILGDHHVHGRDTLLYIGKSTKSTVRARVRSHAKGWLRKEWNVHVFVAKTMEADDISDIDDIERLLIYAHSPMYCSTSVSPVPSFKSPLRIWNIGANAGLLGEVSSHHPWYQGDKEWKEVIARMKERGE